MMASLGYSRNTAPFVELAELVPYKIIDTVAQGGSRAEAALRLQALLLGRAGLLPSQRAKSAGADGPDVTRLEALWQDLREVWDDGWPRRQSWKFASVRPDNYPTRRLVAAAELFALTAREGLLESMLTIMQGAVDGIARAIEARLMVCTSQPYWQQHCDFGRPRSTTGANLIGRARAAEIAVNAVLPLAIAYGRVSGQDLLTQRATAAFNTYPTVADNEVTRYMASLLPTPPQKRMLRTARRQQGLIAIYRHWCFEKRCIECPLGD
jgi:hypothetical protein